MALHGQSMPFPAVLLTIAIHLSRSGQITPYILAGTAATAIPWLRFLMTTAQPGRTLPMLELRSASRTWPSLPWSQAMAIAPRSPSLVHQQAATPRTRQTSPAYGIFTSHTRTIPAQPGLWWMPLPPTRCNAAQSAWLEPRAAMIAIYSTSSMPPWINKGAFWSATPMDASAHVSQPALIPLAHRAPLRAKRQEKAYSQRLTERFNQEG